MKPRTERCITPAQVERRLEENIRLVRNRYSAYRVIEGALATLALVLIGIFVSAYLHRWISSRQALRTFEQQKKTEAVPANLPEAGKLTDDPRKVDFSLWSEKRVREYLHSLNVYNSAPLAVLRVEKLGIRVPVFAGTDDLTLNRGVGWITGTARPGQRGNIGIAGHRDGFFRALKDIAEGDAVELETIQQIHRYRIDSIQIVTPDDVAVLAPRGADSLTLVTCYPFYFIGDAPRRFIVRATKQDGAPGTSSPVRN